MIKGLVRRAVYGLGFNAAIPHLSNLASTCGLRMSFAEHTKPGRVLETIRSMRPVDCGTGLIRIGGSADGGYLIPNDLEGIEYCFSPGVSETAEFENHLANMGIRSFLADYSITDVPLMRPEFTFDKRYLGAADNEQFFTLSTWKNKYLGGYTGDLMLQMDIEGWEYEVLANVDDALLRQFRIIVIEFHDLHRLFDAFAFRIISSRFDKLLQSFDVVHIHPNNSGISLKIRGVEVPRLLEITFLNKKRIKSSKPQVTFPHALDRDCDPAKRPLPLPTCWYQPNGRA